MKIFDNISNFQIRVWNRDKANLPLDLFIETRRESEEKDVQLLEGRQ